MRHLVVLLACLSLLAAACSADGDAPRVPIDKVGPSVVHIETGAGSGSGVVLDDEGHIVTNYHVIEGARVTAVRLEDGTELEWAGVVGSDRSADIAVLKAESGSLEPITLAERAPETGDRVYAFGYPFETGVVTPLLQVSAGIVSTLRPDVLGEVEYVQTDAAVDQGASGGALVNEDGELVALVTGRVVFATAGGLAISAADVGRITNDIIDNGGDEEPVGSRTREVNSSTDEVAGFRVLLGNGDEFDAALAPTGEAALDLVNPLRSFEGELVLYDPSGFFEVASSSAFETGNRSVTYEAAVEGEHILTVVGPDDFSYRLESSHILKPFIDAEDGKRLSVGDVFIGELQFNGDRDTFSIELEANDPIAVTVRSWAFNAYVTVKGRGLLGNEESDDNSGRGFGGSDARLRYWPKDSDEHEIIVAPSDAFFGGRGFYRIEVEDAERSKLAIPVETPTEEP